MILGGGNMRKLILNWLFGIDNVEVYMDLLSKNINHHKECLHFIDDHIKTLNEEKENLDIIRKLIRICENHGIDVDKEIKQIEL